MDPDSEDFQLTPEREAIRSIQFELTPRLTEIISWGGNAHPYLGPFSSDEHDDYDRYKYRPDMALPEPTDVRGFLRWCGLRDETMEVVIQKFKENNPEHVTPASGYTETTFPSGARGIEFPTLKGLAREYEFMLGNPEYDYEESYDGYVKAAIYRGLQPEFAIFCGLHPSDPRAKNSPTLLTKRRWYDKSPFDYAQTKVGSCAIQVQNLMVQKLRHDGKVRRVPRPDSVWTDELIIDAEGTGSTDVKGTE